MTPRTAYFLAAGVSVIAWGLGIYLIRDLLR